MTTMIPTEITTPEESGQVGERWSAVADATCRGRDLRLSLNVPKPRLVERGSHPCILASFFPR
jgi:hypothetical protein